MKPLRRTLFAALLLGVLCAADASALQMDDYIPLTKGELGTPFPLKHVGPYDHRDLIKHLPIGPSGAEVSPRNEKGQDSFYLSGKDRAGKPWSVDFGVKSGFGGNIFAADLDHNGISDLLMIFPTAANGLAPSSHVLTLLFDAAGRPVPFEVEGYYDSERNSLPELVDLNKDGRAELVAMNFDDGYWITNLYEARDGRWQRLKGRFASRSYPLFTRFTNRPNHKAVTPMKGRHPFAQELSNRAPVASGRVLSFKITPDKDARDNEDADYTLSFRLKDAAGKSLACEPDYWYGSAALILDRDDGRRVVALWSNQGAVKRMLEEIIRNRYPVSLYGRRFADKLSPELIWAAGRK